MIITIAIPKAINSVRLFCVDSTGSCDFSIVYESNFLANNGFETSPSIFNPVLKTSSSFATYFGRDIFCCKPIA